jgi:hypothetical protein
VTRPCPDTRRASPPDELLNASEQRPPSCTTACTTAQPYSGPALHHLEGALERLRAENVLLARLDATRLAYLEQALLQLNAP